MKSGKAIPLAGGRALSAAVIDGTVTFELAGETVSVTLGAGPPPVVWLGGLRLRPVAVPPPGDEVRFHCDEIGHAVATRETTIRRGEEIELAPDLRMGFDGHSHKSTEEGQRSPLMLALAYRVGDAEPVAAYYDLFPPEDAGWRWRTFRFQLLDYKYDRWMKLRIDTLALVPCTVAQT